MKCHIEVKHRNKGSKGSNISLRPHPFRGISGRQCFAQLQGSGVNSSLGCSGYLVGASSRKCKIYQTHIYKISRKCKTSKCQNSSLLKWNVNQIAATKIPKKKHTIYIYIKYMRERYIYIYETYISVTFTMA